MKKYGYTISTALLIIMTAIWGAFINIIPDKIPVHFSITGEPDRYGSKYESLIFLILSIILTVAMFLTSKKKKENGNIFLTVNNIFLVFMNITQVWFFWSLRSYNDNSDVFALSVNNINMIAIFVGALITLLGNFMPKTTKNAVFGMRTSWTMKNDTAWQKSQRFTGILMVISGLIIILDAIFLREMVCVITMIAVMTLSIIISLIGTYKICKNIE